MIELCRALIPVAPAVAAISIGDTKQATTLGIAILVISLLLVIVNQSVDLFRKLTGGLRPKLPCQVGDTRYKEIRKELQVVDGRLTGAAARVHELRHEIKTDIGQIALESRDSDRRTHERLNSIVASVGEISGSLKTLTATRPS